ncbi:MAG TPA: HD domain-containing phosphohydrolase [Sulfuricella sp.]|nr:HD domain-containing phosphohydrolase [Sulfuricella sp.]
MHSRSVKKTLGDQVEGFGRVAQGNLGHQVPILADNEIGRLTQAFNGLSERLRALFRLPDRINRGKQLDETLDFILEEFPAFVPVDWVGVLFPAEGARGLRLERMAGVPTPGLRESLVFPAENNALAQVANEQRPCAIEALARYAEGNPDARLASALAAAGLGSAIYLPLTGERSGDVMVFAAREAHAYTAGHMEFLGNIAVQVGHILERTVVVEGLVVAALQGLAKLAESRDPETGDHLMRMSLYAVLVAEELGTAGPYAGQINSSYVRNIYRFAPMHDIGKVGISDSILLKPGRLDEDERKEMERHPTIGGQALRGCEAQMNALGHSIFTIGIEIAECHHEKWDGSGYPAGLSNQAIPLSARIVAVADVFDALTSKRPYKEAWPVEKVLATIDESAGRHFDPEAVAAMHRALPKMMEIHERFKNV